MKKYRAFLFAVTFWLISAPTALGCLCDGTPSVEEELREASAIFSGKFAAAEYKKGIVNEFRKMQEEAFGEKVEYEVLVLKFQVERWWKGNPASEVILVTNLTRDPDGTEHISDGEYPFKVGERYLVHAYGSENDLGIKHLYENKKIKESQRRFEGAWRRRKAGKMEVNCVARRRSRTSHWSRPRVRVPLVENLGGSGVVRTAAQFRRHAAFWL